MMKTRKKLLDIEQFLLSLTVERPGHLPGFFLFRATLQTPSGNVDKGLRSRGNHAEVHKICAIAPAK